MTADDMRQMVERETVGWPADAVAALIEAIEQMDSPGGWRPFYCPRPGCDGKPHDNWLWAHARADQHPPQDWGDAYILLCLSGRGSGKTRQGSEWVHRVARNYPGSYIGMIAPTVDAARDVLVEGESGILRTANPAFKPTWEPSKRKLVWPNGSQAQTFSADLPERLRGPQHGWLWCFPAGTMIRTESGEEPIERIRTGTLVQTRNGLRPATNLGARWADRLVTVQHAHGSLTGTPEHPIWTGDGWVGLGDIRPGDTVYLWADDGDTVSVGRSSSPVLVPTAVSAVSTSAVGGEVFNLNVWETPEYFANGVLVHNCDEAGSFRNFEETWSNALFGLRLGVAPKVLITTTPRPRQWLRDLAKNPQVIVRRVSTYSNIDNLSQTYRDTVIRRYEGTALGQQELEGEILDDDFGEALWQDSDFRIADIPIAQEELGWHVIGVDPAVTSGGDETGIIVSAATTERDPALRRAVVIGDHTVTSGGPDVWVNRVVNVYRQTPQPCVVVVESNQGGELIGGMIKQIAPDIPVSYVHATKAKAVRAEPIVLAYRMGRVWHTKGLEELQTQQTTWIPGVSKESPGRIDACVHALTALLIDPRMLRNYGRVRSLTPLDNIRTLSVRRSPALAELDSIRDMRRPGLRPPIPRPREERQA